MPRPARARALRPIVAFRSSEPIPGGKNKEDAPCHPRRRRRLTVAPVIAVMALFIPQEFQDQDNQDRQHQPDQNKRPQKPVRHFGTSTFAASRWPPRPGQPVPGCGVIDIPFFVVCTRGRFCFLMLRSTAASCDRSSSDSTSAAPQNPGNCRGTAVPFLSSQQVGQSALFLFPRQPLPLPSLRATCRH